jgi:hypothetical protein
MPIDFSLSPEKILQNIITSYPKENWWKLKIIYREQIKEEQALITKLEALASGKILSKLQIIYKLDLLLEQTKNCTQLKNSWLVRQIQEARLAINKNYNDSDLQADYNNNFKPTLEQLTKKPENLKDYKAEIEEFVTAVLTYYKRDRLILEQSKIHIGAVMKILIQEVASQSEPNLIKVLIFLEQQYLRFPAEQASTIKLAEILDSSAKHLLKPLLEQWLIKNGHLLHTTETAKIKKSKLSSKQNHSLVYENDQVIPVMLDHSLIFGGNNQKNSFFILSRESLGEGSQGKVKKMLGEIQLNENEFVIINREAACKIQEVNESVEQEVAVAKQAFAEEPCHYLKTDRKSYFFMPYRSGMPLSGFINQVNSHEGLNIIMALFKAVSKLHQKGIVHRDLKPANIIYNRETGEVFIIDFGISQQSGNLDRARGTIGYMAPEVEDALNESRPDVVNPKADIFSLSVVAASLLSKGMTPCYFRNPSTYEERVKYIEKRFAKITEVLIQQSIPENTAAEISALLKQMAEPESKKRMSDLNEIITKLESIQAEIQSSCRLGQ